MNLIEDALIEKASGFLHARLVGLAYQAHRKLTPNVLDRMDACVKEHRRECARKGLAFPEVVLIVLPEQGAIEAVRRDADHAAVQTHILNLTVKYPKVTPAELAQAIRRAFPQYRPTNFDLKRKPVEVQQATIGEPA